MASSGDEGIHPVGQGLHARHSEDGGQDPPSRQQPQHGPQGARPREYPAVGENEVNGARKGLRAERRKPSPELTVFGGHKVQTALPIDAPEPFHPPQAEAAGPVVEQYWPAGLAHGLVLMLPGGSP